MASDSPPPKRTVQLASLVVALGSGVIDSVRQVETTRCQTTAVPCCLFAQLTGVTQRFRNVSPDLAASLQKLAEGSDERTVEDV